jgi:FkbM family methyltransferase
VTTHICPGDSIDNSLATYRHLKRVASGGMLTSPRENHWTVWDLGANHGEDTSYYLALGCRVVAVEPNPALADAIRTDLAAHVDSGALTVVDAAVVPHGGPDHVTLSIFDNDEWSTVRADWVARNVTAFSAPPVSQTKVRAVSMRSLLAEHECPDMIKIDIEGVDLSIMGEMASDPSAWSRLQYLTWETMFQESRSLPVLREQVATAARIGFGSFAISPQNHPHVEVGTTARGTWPPPLNYPFRYGSSGPFGDQLNAEWFDAKEVVRAYGGLSAVRRGRLYGPESLVDRYLPRRATARAKSLLNKALGPLDWYDIHSRRLIPSAE